MLPSDLHLTAPSSSSSSAQGRSIWLFAERCALHAGSVITELTVGMGPAGELRYFSYPEQELCCQLTFTA